MEIKHNKFHNNKGSFSATEEDHKIGEMFYTWVGQDRIIIDHTEVKEASQGKGIGNNLLEATVAFAREKEIKIIPLCPFAKAVFEKDATLRDVL